MRPLFSTALAALATAGGLMLENTACAAQGPQIDVAPAVVTLTAETNGSATDLLTIGNTGDADLSWTIAQSNVATPAHLAPHKGARARSARKGSPARLTRAPASLSAAANSGGSVVPLAPTEISQMADNTPDYGGVGCPAGGSSWWRRFYFDEHPEVAAKTVVQSVTIATGGDFPGGMPSIINLYTLPSSVPVDTIPVSQLTLIGSAPFLASGSLELITVPVTGLVHDTENMNLVVEWFTGSGGYFPGTNNTHETHPSFISSEACDFIDPETMGDVGFPESHLIMIVTVDNDEVPGCDNPADVPWLSAAPASGTTPAGSSSDVSITADATGLALGSHAANICVASNDTDSPMVTVPISLEVVQGPPPAVAKSFSPEAVSVNETSVATVTLSNPGQVDAVLASPLVDNLPAGLDVVSATTTCLADAPSPTLEPSASVTLPAGTVIPANGSCTLEITVSAATAGAYVNEIPAGALVTTQGSNEDAAAATLTVTGAPAVPEIAVTPDSLSATQGVSEISTHTLSIANIGTGDLNWTIDEQDGSPGLAMQAQSRLAQPAVESLPDVDLTASMPASTPAPLWLEPMAFLFDNGPLATGPGRNGADLSVMQSSLGTLTYGYNASLEGGYRLFDDFEVPAAGWTVDTITFFAYQTDSTTTSTITGVNLRIWDGPPDVSGSSVVFGDTSTNRMADTAFSNIYRVTETNQNNTGRPIMAVVATVGTFLAEGTYWVDWQLDGTLDSGPWVPAVTLLGETGKLGANALQLTPDGWKEVTDVGSYAPQDLPFIIEGSIGDRGGSCPGPSDVPWLSVAPAAGSNIAGSTTSVTVTFDSGSLAPGSYSAELCVASNDPVEPIVIVPVSLVVEAAVPSDGIFCNGFDGEGNSCPGPVVDPDLVVSGPLNHPVARDVDGTSLNWITGMIGDGAVSGAHFNPYDNGHRLAFWWATSAPDIAGVSSDAARSDFLVLGPGAVVGPSSTWSTNSNPGPAAWAAGTRGYLGIRFNCAELPSAPANGICYGYVHLETTGPTGFPATILGWAYDQAGNPVTIP